MPYQTKILITGITSLFGKYLVKNLSSVFNLYGFYHQIPVDMKMKIPKSNLFGVNITDFYTVNKLIKIIKPDAVIHLAAISNIDICEKNPQDAKSINTTGTENIIRALKNTRIYLIFVSSNAIFSGRNAPYKESQIPHPVNIYGKTKYQAEKIILKSEIPSIIVRFSSMFGYPPRGTRDNDVTYYLKRIQENLPLYLVNDRFFNPIYADTAAKMIKKIIYKKPAGILHLGGRDRISRYQFVKKIISVFFTKTKYQLMPVKSSFFPKLAPRPKDITLNTKKAQKLLNYHPQSIETELIKMTI